jgi:hypothetical protein
MNYVSSITVDQVIVALANFLQPFVNPSEIIRAQTNRVPMPPDPCVVLTELLQVDIETPQSIYNTVDAVNFVNPKKIDIQIDFYGDGSGDRCAAIKTVFRTAYAADQFPDGIKPLFCSDGIQSPLITGEQQWESRWTLTATLQYNPETSVPQEFANELTTNLLVDVDATYSII